MSASAWVALMDRLIDGQARILAWGDSIVTRQVKRDMNNALKDLRARAAVAHDADTKARLDAAIADATRLHAEAIQEGSRTIRKAQQEAAERSEESVRAAFQAAEELLPGSVRFGFDQDLSPAQLRQAAGEPFFGWDMSRWSEFYEIKTAQDIDRVLRAGWLAGDSIEDMTATLVSVTDKDTREMEVLARTAVETAANRAAEETYTANRDVLDGMRFVATLDTTTCEQCGAMDGTVIAFGEGPTPPLHHNCRCFLAPEVKPIPGLEIGTAPTWSEWITGSFGNLSDEALRERQEAVLGPTVAELLSSGWIKPDDLITDSGRRRTVEEIEATADGRRGRRAA